MGDSKFTEVGYAKVSLQELQESVADACGKPHEDVITPTPDPSPKFVPGVSSQVYVPVSCCSEENSSGTSIRVRLPWGTRKISSESVVILSHLATQLAIAAHPLYDDICELFELYLDSVIVSAKTSDTEKAEK